MTKKTCVGQYIWISIYMWCGDGAVVRGLASHQCILGSIPGPCVTCGFSHGYLVFLPPQKSTLLNSNSIWKQWMKGYTSWKCHCKFLFIYFFIYSLQNVHDKSMKLGEYEITKNEVTESQILYQGQAP